MASPAVWLPGRACWRIHMDKRLILVTGATGYIASRLIPRLLENGYRVRCMARNPSGLDGRRWLPEVEVVQGDVTVISTLAPALEGVRSAYYLVHNMTSGRGYTERELGGARAFASAAEAAGVEHIIYLGGLADPQDDLAPHMRSRIETGSVLRQGRVPVTEFRAGVITGSGSISFEMIRFMTELFPIVPGPSWLRNRSQPIAMQNVIDYLAAALDKPAGRGRVFEIGGPDIATYGELMLRYAAIRGLRRRMILLPWIPLWLMAFGVGLVTPVPRRVAYALIAGLSNDSVVREPQALEVFPEVRLLDYESAARHALERTHPSHIERVWGTAQSDLHITHEGCFIDHLEISTETVPERLFPALRRLVDERGWYVEANAVNQRILARAPVRRAGESWVEWRLDRTSNLTRLSQTVYFSPHGLPGFLHWYLRYPLHARLLRRLLRKIVGTSEGK